MSGIDYITDDEQYFDNPYDYDETNLNCRGSRSTKPHGPGAMPQVQFCYSTQDQQDQQGHWYRLLRVQPIPENAPDRETPEGPQRT